MASNPCIIEDSIWIKTTPARLFNALSVGSELAHWWPLAAESDPKPGGKIVLTWFNGSTMESRFETFIPEKEVAYPFYTEKLSFTLTPEKDGTKVAVRHQCDGDSAIHVSQCWGRLTAYLKCWIEHGIDLHRD